MKEDIIDKNEHKKQEYVKFDSIKWKKKIFSPIYKNVREIKIKKRLQNSILKNQLINY